ncbi:a74ba69e-6933-463b-a012-7c96e9a3b314 [Sclerotinia trifoliorum]|uniref:A74ba69e-6933-463b-a012-7c96e9a3b314 n=1 Tax=Sclerotinia trifoliorum TaxID=28548 RepID=A0A8H2ZN07_9HELO|nr:a74ba69e-6933-463b-a012-7c96e9a3b314 [Sclerotinia trifoliorum]
MPSYFYHIKFELYSLPDSDPKKVSKRERGRDIWIPGEGTNIFDSHTSSSSVAGSAWPKHKSVAWEQDRRRKGGTGSSNGSEPERNTGNNIKEARDQIRPGGAQGAQNGAIDSGVRKGGVIDCGPSRGIRPEESENLVILGTAKDSQLEIASPSASLVDKKRDLQTSKKDWRFGRVRIESLDMNEVGGYHGRGKGSQSGSVGVNAGLEPVGGKVTKARFEELHTKSENGLELKNTEVGWGVVHLYREGEETPGLMGVEVYNADTVASPTNIAGDSGLSETVDKDGAEDCTILCIPAVPSYLTPRDFLGFVGEKTMCEVSHFRMVMTGRMNRYMVLMKFKDGNVARKWRAEWDGKVFNSMEPETCHVMFIKSITFQTPASSRSNTSFPELSHDPFTPAPIQSNLKPFPPPTPNLVELPTCPVCLERMDDTTGLFTILCQHVFHCACLEKWRGTGCPVCRHTNPSLALSSQHSSSTYDPDNPPFGSGEASLCSICDCTDDLWICLICGNVGCGRYKGGHAKEHWKDSAHNFALEIETQHVWDYAGDIWVHRLIRDKGDNSKVIELPSSRSRGTLAPAEDMDMVPREKLENAGLEFTHLLTSQLESQRVYFEELVGKAVAKASAASEKAIIASRDAENALSKLGELEEKFHKLSTDTLPNLEKELEREKRKERLRRFEGMGKSLREEKKVSEGLMERIG